MAYPMQCHAGFPMPLLAGKYEILGFTAAIETTGSVASIALFDDSQITTDAKFGRLIPTADILKTKVLLCDLGEASLLDYYIDYTFPEPVKVRNGLSIAADNIKGGSICVYRR